MQLMIHEILEQVSKEINHRKKIEILRANDNNALRMILRGALDPDIEWLLPETRPEFKPDDSPKGLAETNLYRMVDTFYLYCNKGLPRCTGLTQAKREHKFIQMLESIPPGDAEVALKMIHKKPLGNGITVKLVKEAFPGFMPNVYEPREPQVAENATVQVAAEEIQTEEEPTTIIINTEQDGKKVVAPEPKKTPNKPNKKAQATKK